MFQFYYKYINTIINNDRILLCSLFRLPVLFITAAVAQEVKKLVCVNVKLRESHIQKSSDHGHTVRHCGIEGHRKCEVKKYSRLG